MSTNSGIDINDNTISSHFHANHAYFESMSKVSPLVMEKLVSQCEGQIPDFKAAGNSFEYCMVLYCRLSSQFQFRIPRSVDEKYLNASYDFARRH
jgi:hypothetical protein